MILPSSKNKNKLKSRSKTQRRNQSSGSTRDKNKRFRKQKTFKPNPIALILPKKGSPEKMQPGTLDYKNVVLLRQYLTFQGKILPRKRTGLTAKEQRKLAKTIKTSRVMGFLPFIRQTS